MKTYYEYMKEIQPNELYEGLLGFGLFSEKIPPIFSSVPFWEYCNSQTPTFEDRGRSFVQYDSMRNTNVIRELGIPTPMAYQQLCACLRDNWSNILFHFQKNEINQQHIISRIHIRKMANTPVLFKMNYQKWQDDGSPELDLIFGSKYIVHADISKCFPSIYTHSLPWALIGKSKAKKEKGKRESWYNQLDHFIQNCKYGETHGLIIGPHASNLLAEIILTSVDNDLSSQGWKYTRHIDDFCCYVESFADAQRFLVSLNAALKKYDLSINDKKTEISELPAALTKQWKRRIDNPRIYYRGGIFDYISARSYFDNAIEIMKNNKNDSAILNYAIKALPVSDMSQQAKILCVKTIFHLCLLYPYLVHIMDEFVFERFHVDVHEIERFANELYKQELKVNNTDAICYALYFSLKYGFTIKSLNAQDAIDSDSCVFKLLSFLQFKKERNKSEKAMLRSHACELKKDNEDFDRNWLFIYEILPQSDLPGDWKELKKNHITFLKI